MCPPLPPVTSAAETSFAGTSRTSAAAVSLSSAAVSRSLIVVFFPWGRLFGLLLVKPWTIRQWVSVAASMKVWGSPAIKFRFYQSYRKMQSRRPRSSSPQAWGCANHHYINGRTSWIGSVNHRLSHPFGALIVRLGSPAVRTRSVFNARFNLWSNHGNVVPTMNEGTHVCAGRANRSFVSRWPEEFPRSEGKLPHRGTVGAPFEGRLPVHGGHQTVEPGVGRPRAACAWFVVGDGDFWRASASISGVMFPFPARFDRHLAARCRHRSRMFGPMRAEVGCWNRT